MTARAQRIAARLASLAVVAVWPVFRRFGLAYAALILITILPPMAAGAARIRVTYQVDADGLLSVSARESTTGIESSVEVKPSYGLSDGEITRMLRDSFEHARDDMRLRALGEHRVDAQLLLDATRDAGGHERAIERQRRAPVRLPAVAFVDRHDDRRALGGGKTGRHRAPTRNL